jgi:hypothetical protein
MTDRILDKPAYPECRMQRLPAWVLRFELRSHVKFTSGTNYCPFFGRPQEAGRVGGKEKGHHVGKWSRPRFGEWHGQTSEKISMSFNVPALKIIPALRAQKD